MAEMTRYVQERKYYAEACAEFYDYRSNPRFKTVELFRLFKESRPDLRASGLEMLDKFVSTANAASIEADTACDYVDNPQVSQGKATYAGRWRLVSNKQFRDPSDSSIQGILQHLKLYWNTTILAGTTPEAIDWTRARVVSYESSPGNTEAFDGSAVAGADPAKLAIIEWTAVAPSAVATIVTEFAANFPTTAFTVDGQAFPAGWAYIFAAVSDDKTDFDGAKIVRFVVGRPEFVLKYRGQLLSSAAFTGYVVWDLPKALAQTVLDAVIAAHPQGVSITPDYNEGNHTVTLRLRLRDSLTGSSSLFQSGGTCMQTEVTTVYSGYTLVALQALLTVLSGQVASGIWYTVSGIREDKEDGLWDCNVTKYTAVEVAQAVHTTVEAGLGFETTERTFNNRSSGSLPLAARTQGVVQRRNVQKNPNCTEDVARIKDTSYQVSAKFSSLRTASDWRNTSAYRNSRSKLEAPANIQGAVYEAENQINEDTTYDGRIVERISYPMSVNFRSLYSGAEGRNASVYRNLKGVLNASLSSQGKVFNAENTLNDDYTYDSRLTQIDSYARNFSFHSLHTGEADVYVTGYKASRAVIGAPENTQRSVWQAENAINDDNTYDSRLTRRVSIPSSIATNIFVTALRSGSETVQKNVTSVPGVIGGRGRTEQYSGRLNEDGTYDLNLRSVASQPSQVKFTSLISPVGTVETSSYVNKLTPVTAGITSIGIGSYRVSNEENEEGTYRGDVVYSQPPAAPRVVSFDSMCSLLREQEQTSYQFARAKLDAPPATIGHSYSVDNRLTEDGTYAQDLVYDRGIPHLVSESVVKLDDDSIGYVVQGRNFLEFPAIEDESASFRTVELKSLSVNELGAYDYQIDKTYTRDRPLSSAYPATWDLYDTSYSGTDWLLGVGISAAYRRLYTHTVTYHRTEAAAIAAITGGMESSAHRQLGDFLWRAEKVTQIEYVKVYP